MLDSCIFCYCMLYVIVGWGGLKIRLWLWGKSDLGVKIFILLAYYQGQVHVFTCCNYLCESAFGNQAMVMTMFSEFSIPLSSQQYEIYIDEYIVQSGVYIWVVLLITLIRIQRIGMKRMRCFVQVCWVWNWTCT